MTFELEDKQCKLRHLNVRNELHGEERVLAADLEFEGDFEGSVLEMFHPGLQEALYAMSEAADMVDKANGTPTRLKFPSLGVLKLEAEVTGAWVGAGFGVGEGIAFDLANVGKFRVECMDGGTVSVRFRVQVKPDDNQLSKLAALLDSAVPVTIRAPKVEDPIQ